MGSKITVDSDCSHKIKTFAPWKESYDKSKQHIKKQRYPLANKGPYSQSNGCSNSHVQMWELNHRESWVPKNWCFWIVVLEKTLESPLDCKKIKPINPKGNQSWIFIGRNDADAETEAPMLWSPDVKSQLIGKDLNAGKDWGQDRKGVTEGEMVGWHHRFNGHEFGQTLGDSEEQGSLGCSSPGGSQWVGHDWTTEQQESRHVGGMG